jgi:transcription termination factor NusB
MQKTLSQNQISIAVLEKQMEQIEISQDTDLKLFVEEDWKYEERFLTFYYRKEADNYFDKQIENILNPEPEIREIIQHHIDGLEQTYTDIIEEGEFSLTVILADDSLVEKLKKEFEKFPFVYIRGYMK